MKFNEVVVIDLEATCWESRTETAAKTSEIIEVGICVLDVLTGEITKPQGIIVKPIASEISPFCEQLTGITQEMVDAGVTFESAIKTMVSDYSINDRIVAAYVNYDRNKLKQECARYGIEFSIGHTYLNVSALAILKLKTGKRLGLDQACEMFGLPFEGRMHRGVDDAQMIAKVLWEIIK